MPATGVLLDGFQFDGCASLCAPRCTLCAYWRWLSVLELLLSLFCPRHVRGFCLWHGAGARPWMPLDFAFRAKSLSFSALLCFSLTALCACFSSAVSVVLIPLPFLQTCSITPAPRFSLLSFVVFALAFRAAFIAPLCFLALSGEPLPVVSVVFWNLWPACCA